MSNGALVQPTVNRANSRFAQIEDRIPRLICLAIVVALVVVSAASYFQSETIKSAWPWQDQAMTYRFFGAYLLAFAGSLFWVAVTGEIVALAGIAVTVVVNSVGATIYLTAQAIQENSTELIPSILVVAALLVISMFVFRWSAPLSPKRIISTPTPIRVGMIVFPLVLLAASIRLMLQHRNVFPWDPHAEWSSIIGLSLMGSVAFFVYGALRGGWTHSGAQFAGFLAYDLVLIVPYVRMLRDSDDSGGSSMYGGSMSGAGTSVNEGPLALFLVAIGSSAILAIWYLFIERRTRLFKSSVA